MVSYISGQHGRNHTFYTQYAFRKEYASFDSYVKNHNYANLDYVYSTLSNHDGENPVDYEAFAANPTEFTVPAKLKELYAAKDFGRYANAAGELPTCFLADCDITGGNSGSPVLNGKGSLIGLAFDGNWEAMSGDVAFEPELQRTIAVDVRYVLFVIDKFAGAGWLLDELQFE